MVDMEPAPRRHRFQIRLRTLFVLTAILAITFAAVAPWYRKYEQERIIRELFEHDDQLHHAALARDAYLSELGHPLIIVENSTSSADPESCRSDY